MRKPAHRRSIKSVSSCRLRTSAAEPGLPRRSAVMLGKVQATTVAQADSRGRLSMLFGRESINKTIL